MSDAQSWIEDFENAVRRAAATIGSLRRERDELAGRVLELEARVGGLEPVAEGAGASGATADLADQGAAAGWREERREIRRRVERLTERLEGLVEQPE